MYHEFMVVMVKEENGMFFVRFFQDGNVISRKHYSLHELDEAFETMKQWMLQ